MSYSLTNEELRDKVIDLEQALLDYSKIYITKNNAVMLSQENHDALLDLVDRIYKIKQSVLCRITEVDNGNKQDKHYCQSKYDDNGKLSNECGICGKYFTDEIHLRGLNSPIIKEKQDEQSK